MDVVLIVAGALLQVTGLVGCILPILPGPPLSFAGLLLLWGARGWAAATFGPTTVILLGVLAVAVTVLDTVAPVIGARRYGASRTGLWGSVIGMVVGLVFFPPFGLLAGAFLGALVGEWLVGQAHREAARAAWGVFVGTLAGIGLKLAVSVATAIVFGIEVLD